MYFQKIGDSGPTIIFLHGWGCDCTIFAPIVNDVRGVRYLLDLNGFGKSQKPPEDGWTTENFADELFLFCNRNNLQKVSIVAHSFGCRVAMVFAAKYADKIDKMLLYAPAGVRHFNFKRWLKVRAFKFCKIFRNKDKSFMEKFGSADYLACDVSMRNTFVKVVNQDLRRYAKKVKCPVLIINGKNDTAVPLRNAKELHNLMKNSVFVEISGDHFELFRSPKIFARIVNDFMRS